MMMKDVLLTNWRRNRIILSFVSILVGLTITIILYNLFGKLESRQQTSAFDHLAADQYHNIQLNLDDHRDALMSVRALFDSSDSVSQKEFEIFTKGWLGTHKDIIAIEWLPRVSHAQLKTFEESARKSDSPGFEVVEFNEHGSKTQLSVRNEYFPVRYVEPIEGRGFVLGSDLSSDPTRWHIMQLARDNGTAMASDKVQLLKPNKTFGFYLFAPVFAGHDMPASIELRRQDLSGFVAVLASVAGSVDEAVVSGTETGTDYVNVYVYEGDTANEERLLYAHKTTALVDDSLSWSRTMDVAGKTWLIVCRPTELFFVANPKLPAWPVAIAGILLTAIATVYIFGLFGRVEKMRSMVEDRTLDLSKANSDLGDEIVRRISFEKKLSGQYVFIQNVMDALPSAVFFKGVDGRYLGCNKAFETVMGFPREDIIGKTVFDINPRELAENYAKHDQEMLTKPGVSQYEFKVKFSDGKMHDVLFVKSTFNDIDDNVIGIIGVMVDISERKQIEDALKESEDRFRSISEFAHDAIIMMDNHGHVSFWNNAAEQIFGYTREEVMGKELHKLIAPSHYYPEYKNAFKYFALTGVGPVVGTTRDLQGLRKDGSEFAAELSVSAHQIRGEWCAIGIVRDVSERRRLEQMKSEFVNIVSHEIRTPMHVLKEGIAQVLDGLHGEINEKQRRSLNYSLKETDRLIRIVNDLLDISKLESGRIELHLDRVNVVEAIKGEMAASRAYIKERGLELRETYSSDSIEMMIDRDKLMQIMSNLLSNAMKFTASGYIDVVVTEKRDEVEFRVRDTGMGIAPDNIPRLFNKFQQLDNRPVSGEKGTGLGLAICKGYAELHKGKIRVESQLGRGSTFIVTIPKTI